MWLSLLLLLLLFAITIYQAKQGLFSAFLMTALTLCCATAALGTYEWVAIHWLAPYWKPDYAHPIALGATFGLPLLILRVVFDRLIRRACLLPGWMDRVGGSVCGLVTGLIMVGVVAIGLKMIPFGTSIIGYAPVVVSPQPKERTQSTKVPKAGGEERNLLLGVDRFAAAVTSVLSGGIFSGRQSFYQYNPDLVQAVGWVGAAHPMISRYAPPKSISVTHTEPIEFVYRFTPGEEGQSPTYEPTETRNGKFHVVKIELRSSARDERKSFTFTLRQFRLVGHPKGSDTYEQYYPIAIQDLNDLTRHIRHKKQHGQLWPVVDDIYSPRSEKVGNLEVYSVEMVFDLPREFEPTFLEYKRAARAAVSFDGPAGRADAHPARRQPPERTASAQEAPGESSTASAPQTERKPRTDASARPGRRARGVAAAEGGSRFSDEFPVTLRSYLGVDANISKGALADGHLIAELDRQANGSDPPISRFNVPQDKRLLQLNSRPLKARSTLGGAMTKAITTVQNYFVEDTNGKRYKVVGKYAIAKARGPKIIEVQYFSNPAGSIGGLGAFTRIKEVNLKPDDEFVLLFLVDPGVRIVSFSTGSSASAKDDLTDENLTAPP